MSNSNKINKINKICKYTCRMKNSFDKKDINKYNEYLNHFKYHVENHVGGAISDPIDFSYFDKLLEIIKDKIQEENNKYYNIDKEAVRKLENADPFNKDALNTFFRQAFNKNDADSIIGKIDESFASNLSSVIPESAIKETQITSVLPRPPVLPVSTSASTFTVAPAPAAPAPTFTAAPAPTSTASTTSATTHTSTATPAQQKKSFSLSADAPAFKPSFLQPQAAAPATTPTFTAAASTTATAAAATAATTPISTTELTPAPPAPAPTFTAAPAPISTTEPNFTFGVYSFTKDELENAIDQTIERYNRHENFGTVFDKFQQHYLAILEEIQEEFQPYDSDSSPNKIKDLLILLGKEPDVEPDDNRVFYSPTINQFFIPRL